jgi:hypothetical protein
MDMNATEITTDDFHPIDIVEHLAHFHEWDFDRVADDQIAMIIDGAWANYTLSLAWHPHDETLRMICTFDMDPPEDRLPGLYDVLNRTNDKNWTGAFSLWREQSMMVYRYGLNLTGGATASAMQIEDIVSAAVAACERYYPAFQLACWGDSTAEESMKVAMEDAYGRA